MRLPWILAALALLAFGLAFLAAALWQDEGRSKALAARERVAVTASPVASAPELRDPADAFAEPVRSAPAAALPVADGLVARTSTFPALDQLVVRLLVRGRVRAPVHDLERTTVELGYSSGKHWYSMRGACASDGSYLLDASDLLGADLWERKPCQFELTVTHPDCIAQVASFVISSDEGQALPERWSLFPWQAGTTTCELDVALILGAFVRGTLVGVDDPRQFAVAAAVERDGSPVPPWLAQTRPDEHGAFELLLTPGASYAVVAAGPELRPALVWIELYGTGARAISLAPERGAEISGVVRIAPGYPSCDIGVELQFAREPGSAVPPAWPRLAPNQDTLVWIDGGFEWRVPSARTDTRGSFTCGGLAPRAYDLRALGVGTPGETLRAWPVGQVRAPAKGVTLGPVLASLDLDLGVSGPHSFHLVDQRGSEVRLGPYSTDARGLAQLHLPPGRDYRVMVGEESFGSISTPAAGEIARFALARTR